MPPYEEWNTAIEAAHEQAFEDKAERIAEYLMPYLYPHACTLKELRDLARKLVTFLETH